MKRALTLLPISLSLGALALAGCGSDDPVSIENPWARTSAAGQTTGAVYFELTIVDDDTLVAASVPASIAREAQVHDVVPAETDGDMDSAEMDDEMDSAEMDDEMDGEMSDDQMDESGDMEGSEGMDDMESGEMGAMVMQELTDGLALTAGETVMFEPGGYHIMLLDIAEPLEVGDEVEVTLDFAEAESVTITAEVAESAP